VDLKAASGSSKALALRQTLWGGAGKGGALKNRLHQQPSAYTKWHAISAFAAPQKAPTCMTAAYGCPFFVAVTLVEDEQVYTI